jgi:hypothetical protein
MASRKFDIIENVLGELGGCGGEKEMFRFSFNFYSKNYFQTF